MFNKSQYGFKSHSNRIFESVSRLICFLAGMILAKDSSWKNHILTIDYKEILFMKQLKQEVNNFGKWRISMQDMQNIHQINRSLFCPLQFFVLVLKSKKRLLFNKKLLFNLIDALKSLSKNSKVAVVVLAMI